MKIVVQITSVALKGEFSMVEAKPRMYFKSNCESTYIKNDYVKENTFKEFHTEAIPNFKDIKDMLPIPVWSGHQREIDCYYKAWEVAFGNLRNPKEDTGFVSPFIDTAFNGDLFMWDSSFILMFGKYAAHIFDFQQTLDNMYSHQHNDGYICRQLNEETGKEKFTRFDPAATGPNIMPWAEWEYYLISKDKERLARVFPCLLAYHKWLKDNHTWRDGSYWSSGWGCGMDDMKCRFPEGKSRESVMFSNGRMVWADTTLQQIFSGKMLINMAKILGRDKEALVLEIQAESEYLTEYVNTRLWDEEKSYYFDLWENNELNGAMSVGAYWALLADVVPMSKMDKFVEHLDNEEEFKRPHRVPSVAATAYGYCPEGGYWNGSVWAPTNYMVLKGLEKQGYHKLAYEIAANNLDCVTKVFEETGTLYENYMPEHIAYSSPHGDFVGWTGLIPISVMIEYVFGITSDVPNNKIVWRINRTEEHGVLQYPFGRIGRVDLICRERNDKGERPIVEVKSDIPLQVEIVWNDNHEFITA